MINVSCWSVWRDLDRRGKEDLNCVELLKTINQIKFNIKLSSISLTAKVIYVSTHVHRVWVMENVDKDIIVDTSLLFDRAKVEQFSAGRFSFNLLSRQWNVVIADYDLVGVLIERLRQQFDCFKEWQLVSNFSCDLYEWVEEMWRCLWNLLEIMPVDCVANLKI